MLDNSESLGDFSSEIASQYVRIRDQLTSTDGQIFAMVEQLGITGKDVLDLGCGDGRYSLKLKSMGARSVVGIDNNQTMIDLADKKSSEGVRFLLSDSKDLPFQDSSFDLVFAYFVLHHLKDTAPTLREIFRVLRTGGSLVAAQTTLAPTSSVDTDLPIPIKLRKGQESVTVSVYPQSDEALKSSLVAAGFEIISYDIVSNPESTLDPTHPLSGTLQKQTVIFHAAKN